MITSLAPSPDASQGAPAEPAPEATRARTYTGPCQGNQHSKSSHRVGVPATPSASPRQGPADGAGIISHAVNTVNAFLNAYF